MNSNWNNGPTCTAVEMDGITASSAIISPDGLYRYVLYRRLTPPNLLLKDPKLGETAPDHRCGTVVFIMLNPSIADGAIDDPTIRRCMGFGLKWGYAELFVVNLFAYRSTNWKALRKVDDPVGPDNDRHIIEVCARAQARIAAWGVHGLEVDPFRTATVRELMTAAGSVWCLGRTGSGEPRHPLMLPANTELQVYAPGQEAP